MSLRVKMISSILLVTLVAWGAAAFRSYQDTRSEVDQLFDAHLLESAAALLKQAAHERRKDGRSKSHQDDSDEDQKKQHDDHEDEDKDEDENQGHGIAELKKQSQLLEKHLIFEIWDGEDRLLLRSGKDLKDQKLPDGFSYSGEGPTSLRVFTQWSTDRTLKVVVAESASARLNIANASVRNVLRPMLWMILPLIILLALIIELTLRPIRQLSADVEKRSAEDLTPINETSVPKELRATIRALNALFSRLTKAIENERRFTADAAHELRTPLAAIKIQAQVALREKDASARNRALEATILGVDRAAHLVEQLLTLARLDPEASKPIDAVPLREITRQVLQTLAPSGVAKSIEIELVEGESPLIRGQRGMLEILIRNLVDNAIRYTPAGGKVSAIILEASDGVRLMIEDTGPGLNEQQMQVVGERFSRVSRPSGEGSGLGLSIVQKIASIHQATLKLENKLPGPGLMVTVHFQKF